MTVAAKPLIIGTFGIVWRDITGAPIKTGRFGYFGEIVITVEKDVWHTLALEFEMPTPDFFVPISLGTIPI
jgi:hypothetical protein